MLFRLLQNTKNLNRAAPLREAAGIGAERPRGLALKGIVRLPFPILQKHISDASSEA